MKKAQWKSWLRRAGGRCLDWLYPPRCPVCDRLLGYAERGCCRECRKSLPLVRPPFCLKCGKPVTQEEEFCRDCIRDHHYFERGVAAFVYTGKLRSAVYRMKVQNRRDGMDFYADRMALALEPYLPVWCPDWIVPVPMHWRKKRRRGYNQSELLANRLGERCGIPAARNLVACVRMTAEQKSLDRKGRQRNLRGCFCVRRPEQVRGKTILLVDDVYTTGSTLDELSRTLLEAGAAHIYFVVLCSGRGAFRHQTTEGSGFPFS